jgi:hypothetical protein
MMFAWDYFREMPAFHALGRLQGPILAGIPDLTIYRIRYILVVEGDARDG